MSARLVFIFLALVATQQLICGEHKLPDYDEKNAGKGFHSSGRHVDEPAEFETEKGLLIRQKRNNAVMAVNDTSTAAAPPAPTKEPMQSKAPKRKIKKRIRSRKNGTMTSRKNGTVSAFVLKRTAGFTTVFLGMTSGLVVLGVAHLGLFIWLTIALKKVKRP